MYEIQKRQKIKQTNKIKKKSDITETCKTRQGVIQTELCLQGSHSIYYL